MQKPILDYALNADKAGEFEQSIRRWWPDLPKGALHPDSCGIRPRITPEGTPQSDFVFSGPTDHGIKGLVQLFGIESPGLTSALAIARVVGDLVS